MESTQQRCGLACEMLRFGHWARFGGAVRGHPSKEHDKERRGEEYTILWVGDLSPLTRQINDRPIAGEEGEEMGKKRGQGDGVDGLPD